MSNSNTVRNQLELDLINILQLDTLDEETSDPIIIDLINNGRQSLLHHQDDILEDLFLNAMKDNTQLLIILKESIFNPDLYDEIITRSAEYGRKNFINSNGNGEQILFLVIQFLFNLNNERMMDGYKFNRLWYILISNGLQDLQQLDEFIEIKNNQILFQALREYFRPELFSILPKCKINDCHGLYDFILNNIAEYGWRLRLEHIRNKITPRMSKDFMNHIYVMVKFD